MLHHRRLPLSLAALVLAGAAGLSGCTSGSLAAGPASADASATPASSDPTAPTAPRRTPTATTPASSPDTATDMSITFTHSLHGRTLAFRYTDKGHQHKWLDPTNDVFASHESAGHRIDFGDGHQTGSDAGAMKCSTIGSVSFVTDMPPSKHTYAKPGTYIVSVTGNYCGSASDPDASGAQNHVTRHYTVVVH